MITLIPGDGIGPEVTDAVRAGAFAAGTCAMTDAIVGKLTQ